ncbi:hypothetical protein ACWD4G_03720 [Streptomyces sp. NPDC002643]
MDVTITVRVCDKCKRQDRPATRYSLTADESKPVTRDLCDEDAAPVLAVFDLAVVENSEPEPAEPKPPTQRRAPAKKAAEKRTTPRRRGRTPVKTLEEIEADKQAAAAKS